MGLDQPMPVWILSGLFFLPKPNGLRKERLAANPPQNSRLPTQSENIAPGTPDLQGTSPQMKEILSGSQHDNTMFFLGTEAPMVAALGRCGSLRDTCAAIHLSNKKRS